MALKAGYPVVRKFTIDTGGTNDVYVDIGQCLSLINHRLYRQGRMYRCRVSITEPGATGGAAITTLPDAWWSRESYTKIRKIWMKRVEDIKEVQGKEGIGRWNDFKIGYDNSHHDNFGSALKPMLVTDATGTQAAMASSNEEWNLSELMDNDGNNNSFRMLGTSGTNEIGLIATYSNITNIFAPDPDESGSGAHIYADFAPQSAGGDDSDMDDQGDYPPYHETAFPQMEVLQGQILNVYGLGAAENAAGIQRLSTGYFDAPLGLLRINPMANQELTIEVQAGDYKGVHAPAWE